MDRTANRPLPTGRMTVPEAYAAAIAMGISGVLILWVGINPLCGILSLLSQIMMVVVKLLVIVYIVQQKLILQK